MTVTRVPPRTLMPSAPVVGAEAPQYASRHARAVPSIRRNDANQVGMPTPRPTTTPPGAPTLASSPAPAPPAETDETRGLLASLASSQNRMVEYRDTLPAASDVVKETVNAWFQKAYPRLGETLGEGWTSRLTVRSQPDGPGTAFTEAPLTELPWREVRGEKLIPLQGLTVVHTDANGTLTTPRDLNSEDALRAMRDQVQTLAGDAYRARQNDYWMQPGAAPGETRAESLAFEFGAQLHSEAALRKDDGTLSADGLQTVEAVLASPDMSTRRSGEGPGIHRLMVQGRPQPGAFVLTQRDNEADPGAVLLWQPGRPLQEFSNVQDMRAWAAADRKIPEASVQTLALLNGNLFESRVDDLRDEADRQFERTLWEKPPAGQTLASQMDAATDAGPYLDLAPVIQGRRDLRDAEAYRQWLTSGPDTAIKQEWHQQFGTYARLAAEHQNKAQVAPGEYVFRPERYGDEARVRQYASEAMRKELAANGKDVNPDTTYLHYEEQEPVAFQASPDTSEKYYVPMFSPLQPVAKTVTKKISLTDLALRNADYTQKVGFIRNFTYTKAKIADAQGGNSSGLTVNQAVATVRKVDVGATYPAHLKATLLDSAAGKAAKTHYATLQQARLRAELPATLLNEENKLYDSVSLHRDWIQAVIASPDPARRALVRGRKIEVRPLRLGHSPWSTPQGTTSPIQGVWVVQSRGSGANSPLILMTPGAPDGRTFRHFHSTRYLQDSLNADPAMRQYLASRAGPTVGRSLWGSQTYGTSAENAKTIRTGNARWMTQAPEGKGNFLEQAYEDGVTFAMERARHAATSTVDADNNRTDGILRWAGDLLLSTAAPIVSVPYTLIHAGLNIIDGVKRAYQGNGPQAEQHFLDAFGRILDLIPGPGAKTSTGASRLTPLRRLPEARPGGQVAPPTTVPGIAPMPGRGRTPSSAADAIGIFRGPDTPVGRDVIPADVLDWKLTDSTVKARLVDGGGSMGPGGYRKSRDPQTGADYLKVRGEYYLSTYRENFYGPGQDAHVIYRTGDPTHPRAVEVAGGGLIVRPDGNRGVAGGARLGTPGGGLRQRFSSRTTPQEAQSLALSRGRSSVLSGNTGVNDIRGHQIEQTAVYRGYVFRGDTRGTDDIFENGFSPRTPVRLEEVSGHRGGFGGGRDALDPDGRGISASAYYQKDHAGAFYYGGAKGAHTYLIDARRITGFDLYANNNLARNPGSGLRLPPLEINYAQDIPGHLVVGAFDKNHRFTLNTLYQRSEVDIPLPPGASVPVQPGS